MTEHAPTAPTDAERPDHRGSEALLRRSLDALGDGVMLVAADGVVLLANPACHELLGLPPGTMVGSPLPDVVFDRVVSTDGGPGAARGEDSASRALAGDHVNARVSVYDHPGGRRWLAASGTTIEVDGGEAALVTIRDTTDRREALAELVGSLEVRRQLVSELDRALGRLREANDELDRFAGAVAHDLTAPLTNVTGYAELLHQRVAEDPELSHLADRVLRNSARATQLVQDLLTHARTIATLDDTAEVDLGDVAAWVLDALAEQVTATDATVTVDPLPVVAGAEAGLRQVLLNLIGNALAHHRAEVPPVVHVHAEVDGDTVTLLVDDNGPGVPVDKRTRVLGMGVRLPRTDREVEGSGIGLSSVASVVAHHDGTLTLEDAPVPPGLRVRVVLPRPDDGAPADTDAAAAITSLAVVDDDPDVRQVVRLVAARLGVEVVGEARTAAAGRELLGAHEPGLVVLPAHLPDGDGLDLAVAARERDPAIRVLVHALDDEAEIRREAARHDIRLVVSKSRPSDLVDTITRLVHPRA